MAKAKRAEIPWMVDVEKALGARLDIMLWRQHAGLWAPPYDPKRRVQVAPDGIADIMGVQLRRFYNPNAKIIETVMHNVFQPHDRTIEHFYGQAFAIETKSEIGKQEDSQRDFEDAFTAMCGVYVVAPATRWDIIWDEFGREADPLCAAEGQRLWAEIKARRDEEEAAKPIRIARRKAKR
jgi:hypothetical protein